MVSQPRRGPIPPGEINKLHSINIHELDGLESTDRSPGSAYSGCQPQQCSAKAWCSLNMNIYRCQAARNSLIENGKHYDLINVESSGEPVTQLNAWLWQTCRHVTIYVHCQQSAWWKLYFTIHSATYRHVIKSIGVVLLRLSPLRF